MEKLYSKFNRIALFTFFGFLLFSTTLKSQNFLPLLQDNYAGVSAVHFQPASIVDNRLKFDLEVFAFNFGFENNWVKLDNKAIFDWNSFQDSAFVDKYVKYNDDGKSKNFTQNLEFRALNFMLPISKKDAFAFTFRTREMINIDNISNEVADILVKGAGTSDLSSTKLFGTSGTGQSALIWAEYGATYARVIIDNDKKFLKVGATVKLLQGMGAAYAFEKELSYKMLGGDTIFINADFGFGASANVQELAKYKFSAKPSAGFDIGAEYEYRPNFKKYKYNMDGEYDLWRKDQNKYKWKIGASLLDIGKMKFDKMYNSSDFYIKDTLAVTKLPYGDMDSLFKFIDSNYIVNKDIKYFNMWMPTTLNITFDYNVVSKFYVGGVARIALFTGKNIYSKVHYGSIFAITPRWEGKNFAVAMPVRLNQYSQLTVGMGFRVYNLIIGSNTLFSTVGMKSDIFGADFYVGLKIPIKYKAPKDRDGDEVSDKNDDCPDDKGLLRFKGCPDSDGDGIINKEDLCPYTAGKPEFKGCPDTDNDGVEDKFDKCPKIYGTKLQAGCPDTDNDGVIDQEDSCATVAGLKKFFGCPDTDNDSIPDYLDECPEVAGIALQNGCPDTDGDGIRDALDQCPTVAGLDSLQGCPYIDTDSDGIQDKYDHCPKVAGPIENSGCPYVDTDGDGVLDKDDLCPMTPGIVSNNGCPEIAKEEQEVLNTAFNNLEFETAKSIIKSSSNASLDELVILMKKKPDFKLLIEGHTDDVGNDISNMSLSQNRALAVEKYLILNGIAANRITSKWYGENKPIAPNDTEEGRQKNRRVEMKVIFD